MAVTDAERLRRNAPPGIFVISTIDEFVNLAMEIGRA
jgi:hypothetical protein